MPLFGWDDLQEVQVRAFSILTVAFLAAGCTPGDVRVSPVVRTDSAGVEIVEYARLDSSRVWRVGAEPILSIGQLDGEEPYLFTSASRIQKLDNDRILVVENRAAQVRVFDEQGTFLQMIGRGPGEGPGEFAWVGWAQVVHGDSILVWDSQLHRVSVFSNAGVLGRVTSPTMPEGALLLVAHGAFADGALLVNPVTRRGELVPGSIMQDTTTYALWDPTTTDSFAPVVRIPHRNTYLDLEARYWGIPFAALPRVALGSSSVISTAGDSFAFDRHLQDGRHVLRVRVTHDPRPLGPEAIRAYQDDQIQAQEDPRARGAMRDRFRELPFPDYLPEIDKLVIDHSGHTWVRMYTATESEWKSWHVFDENGVHQAYVQTPVGLEVHDIHEDVILGRWVGEMDVPTVRVYPLDRLASPANGG